ncbi:MULTISPECIES: hypothetical protein [unclassified Dehalobacter]|uniref:hypothetical protein n=1 Tax=unclassified Dehalobacter TaxID=2635733 RepID=UPI0003A73185|nr:MULTISPECIES: hypothetical protein [unclassified Dehalobacter]RJE48975.1 hypothetical protein A7K50_07615 [Dehalobacter sp. MCB1]TCX51712.1 hypothetical protein C1I36_05115 [Dehalobacter sp. 14DCB1]TCX52772.1 hypothetical protein C1I38_06795 [Dehalobacter sp. 12DCB1]
MLEISKQLFFNWNNSKIHYCHWKSNEHLEEGLNGLTDLDVLVSLDNKNHCESILRNLNFIECNPQYGSRYPGVDDWIGYDAQTGRLIHIHLHYQIITGHRGLKEYNLPWSQEALDTRIKDNRTGVYIMEPNMEIMTLYTRIALKASLKKIYTAKRGNFKLDIGTLKEITYLKKRINLTPLTILIKKFYGSDKLLKEFIERQTLTSEDFLSLHKYITKSMIPCCTMSTFTSLVQKNYFNIVLPIRNLLRKKVKRLIIYKKTPQTGGMMIAFIGQDGSGKSTVTDEILEWLTWKLDANKFYLGSGEHYYSWQKTLKKKIENKKIYKIVAVLSALLTLSNHISAARRTYKSLNKAKKYVLCGGIAIFDRYPQTKHFGINDGPKIRVNYVDKISNPLLKKYILYCAKVEENYLIRAEKIVPGLVFKLILPPEISIKRKPEEDFDTVKRKHEIVKSLSFEYSKVYYIDSTMEYGKEIKEIKELIWDNLRKQR